MDSFDLGRLTDFDFEVVCRDLFSELLGENLELFAPGRDEGIDLRHLSTQPEHLVVVQCKHWMRSARAALIRQMENVELSKIQRIKPTRYILATSVELTKEAKDKLLQILTPYVISPKDIYGIEDVVAELNERPHIVRRHLRLWLSSTAILQSILNKSILIRSTLLSEELNESLKVYAPNDSFGRAVQMLEDNRICIIAGIPGIGKTTLAQVLAASYVEKGYELIEISEDADEISRMWDEDVPQFFYYDDFLGQTALGDRLHKNEDSRLQALMRKINRSSNKCLVLTTREYILAQARHQYARLSNPVFNISTCILDLADYTRVIRAEILYNHIYHSTISSDHKAQFARREIYERIIDHQHFNPRLIAQSLELSTPSTTQSPNIADVIISNLANPRSLWEHIVEHELNESDVHLLHVLFTFGPHVPLDVLEKAWSKYSRHLGQPDSTRIFRKSVDTLENTMIKTEMGARRIQVSFHNPSIQDYLGEYIPDQRGAIRSLIESMFYFEQLERIWTIASGRTRHKNLPTQGDSALMEEISRESELVEEFVLQNLNGPSMEDGIDGPDIMWAPRRTVGLHIGNKLDLDRVVRTVLRDLHTDWNSKVWDPEDVVALVNAVAASNHDMAKSNIKRIVKHAIDWLTEDTTDWENLRTAEMYLEELGNLVPSSTLSSIQEDLMRHAEYRLEDWHEGVPSSVSWRELDDVLDYASQYTEPDEVFPGYSTAAASMEEHRKEVKTARAATDIENGSHRIDDSIKVHEIMNLLAED
jgi:hypothetical protein